MTRNTFNSHRILRVGVLAVLVIALAGCDFSEGPSVFDPIADGTYQAPQKTPVLTRVDPPVGQALAGVTLLTLTGENFVPHLDSTFVFFNGRRVVNNRPIVIESITPTQIVVQAPNLPNQDVDIRVGVLRAERFSQDVRYRLLPAVESVFEPYGRTLFAVGMTTDPDGNTYLSFTEDGSAQGVRQSLRGSNVLTPYATPTGTYNGFAFRPGDGLFGVRNDRAVRRIIPGGRDQIAVNFQQLGNTPISLRAIYAEPDGRLWVGGQNGLNGLNLYRLSPTNQVEISVALPGQRVLAIVSANNQVLFSAASTTGANNNQVFRLPVNGNTAGTPEVFYDVAANHPDLQVTSLAIAANGDVFMGTTTTNTSPQVVNQTSILQRIAATGQVTPLYSSLFQGDAIAMSWQEGSLLQVAFTRVVPPANSAAGPLSALLRINTLRTGTR